MQFVSAWAAANAAPKLKVLCLHGYAQNGAVLRDRSGGFRKPFKKSRFELSYPDGLFGCTKDGEDQHEADADLNRRAWWRGHAGQATYTGWDASHASLCELWEREQFDGIIGFAAAVASTSIVPTIFASTVFTTCLFHILHLLFRLHQVLAGRGGGGDAVRRATAALRRLRRGLRAQRPSGRSGAARRRGRERADLCAKHRPQRFGAPQNCPEHGLG